MATLDEHAYDVTETPPEDEKAYPFERVVTADTEQQSERGEPGHRGQDTIGTPRPADPNRDSEAMSGHDMPGVKPKPSIDDRMPFLQPGDQGG